MRTLAQRPGRFGAIRVLERKHTGARLYCIEGSVQTMIDANGVSLFGYVHAAKLLLAHARTVLIIGGAGASLATMLARTGKAVTVVDIDPAAEELARTYFALDERVHWITTDSLPFVEHHNDVFDAVVIDACDAEGLVHPFADADVLARVLMRACPAGSLVVNLVHQDGAPSSGPALAQALAERGFAATLYAAEDGWEGNEVLHLRAQGETETLVARGLQGRPVETRTYLMSLRAFTPRAQHRPEWSRSGK